MKEIIHNHLGRLFVYFTISTLSLTTIYGSYVLTVLYRRASENREMIEKLDERMDKREMVAAKYVPMLEGVKKLTDQHSDILHRIMDRQAYMNKLIEHPLEKKKK